MTNSYKTLSILGSGWLGLPLAEHLKKLGYQINASTRTITRLDQLMHVGAAYYIVDITNIRPDIREFLNAECLIINITDKNMQNYKNLITYIEKSPIKQVLFVSSTSVYKNLNREVIEDEHAEQLTSPLYQIEQLFLQNKNFDTTILRFGGLIGFSRQPGRFFSSDKMLEQADAPVNLIHRDDCIGIIQAIIEKQAWGEVFNGCANSHPSKGKFYTYASSLLGLPAPKCAAKTNSAYKIVSNAKVKSKLTYQFIHPDLMKIKLCG